MPEDLYQSIYNDLKKDGFPVEKLTRTEQWSKNFIIIVEFDKINYMKYSIIRMKLMIRRNLVY